MFVYQNKNNDICVTFTGNKPVETPDYVIVIDEEAKNISVNGSVIENPNADAVEEDVTEEPTDEVVEETTTDEDETEEPAEEE